MLRRRHHAKAQTSREAEGRKEAHEAGGLGRDSAGGVSRGPAGGLTARRGAVLVVQTSFLGDMVLTTPLFALLRNPCRWTSYVRRRRRAGRESSVEYEKSYVRQARRSEPGGARIHPAGVATSRSSRYRAAYMAQGSATERCVGARGGNSDIALALRRPPASVLYNSNRADRQPTSRGASPGARNARYTSPTWARGTAPPQLYPGDAGTSRRGRLAQRLLSAAP